MIESKYTIEYVNPDAEKKQGSNSRKPILSFIFSGILLAALLFFLLNLIPKKIISTSIDEKITVSTLKKEETIKSTSLEKESKEAHSPVVKVAESQEKPKKTIVAKGKNSKITSDSQPDSIKNIVTENKKKIKTAEAVQVNVNQDIEKSLTLLKQQLLESQKKNKELASELDTQIMENMELSTLLEDSLYKINKEDKSYIKELKKLETNTLSKELLTKKPEEKGEQLATVKTTQKEDKPVQSTKTNTKVPKVVTTKPVKNKNRTDPTNQVDLSTTSQVDAIVSAMKESTSKKDRKTTVDKTTSSSASKVELQNKINNLINNDKPTNENTFQNSLNKI